MTTIARIPFAIMLAIIVALVLVIDVVGALAHWGDRTLFLLVIPAGLAAWFLIEYRKLPFYVPESTVAPATVDPEARAGLTETGPSASPSGGSTSPPIGAEGVTSAETDFDDPVVEADRIESESRRDLPPGPAPPDAGSNADEPP
ncbi:MAG: hypothetical protein WB778_02565 [Thermoplasmata archaeon]